MSILSPYTAGSVEKAITSTAVAFASAMAPGANMAGPSLWQYVANTDSWIKQANSTATITCPANASMADGDTVTINDGATSYVFEYDKAADGVTGGSVSWAAGTTAPTVAANLKTAIEGSALGASVTVTNNGDGTLSLLATTINLTVTESGGASVVYGPIASAAAGSMFVPARVAVILDGALGSNLSAIRDTADGKASLTRVRLY